MRLHKGGAGWIDYSNSIALYRDGSLLTTTNAGATWQIQRRDGSISIFGQPWTNSLGNRFLLLTSEADPAGHASTYTYGLAGTNTILLTEVTDADGNASQIYYENYFFPNQITKVVDPFGRTNLLAYSVSGALTGIVDVLSITNTFTYDAGNPGWITNLTTPYGTTAFWFDGSDVNHQSFTGGGGVNRFVQVTLPNGGQHLYLYQQDCSGFMSPTDTEPSTSPFGNTLDNVDHDYRNSFHWGPLQCSLLSTTVPTALAGSDYLLGRLRHWLTDPRPRAPRTRSRWSVRGPPTDPRRG